MMKSFNNNENKVYLLLKDDVGGSRVRSCAKSHDPGSCDHSVTIAFLFSMSFDTQFNYQKSYFATR